MQQICDFVDDCFFSENRMPSTTEIGEYVGVCRATAYNYLVAMDKIGMIEYDGKSIKTDKMRKTSSNNSGIEMYDRGIPCGELEELDASVSEYVNLPTSIFGSGDLFVLRTTGDSMINAGIEPGDYVVAERQQNAGGRHQGLHHGDRREKCYSQAEYALQQIGRDCIDTRVEYLVPALCVKAGL